MSIKTTLMNGDKLQKGQIIQLVGQHYYIVSIPADGDSPGNMDIVKGISTNLQKSLLIYSDRQYAVCDITKEQLRAKFKPKPIITQGAVTTATQIDRSARLADLEAQQQQEVQEAGAKQEAKPEPEGEGDAKSILNRLTKDK